MRRQNSKQLRAHLIQSSKNLQIIQLPHLQARIGFLERTRWCVRPPRIAVLVECVPVDSRDGVSKIVDPLQEINRQSVGHVPSNVAMHEPGTGVVALECDDDPATRGEHGNVTARGVLAVETVNILRLVEDVARLREWRGVGRAAENDKVVSVQMEGVGEREAAVGIVLNEPVGPLVHRVDVDQVVGGGVGGVGLHNILGNGFLPVHVDGGAVHLPHEEGGYRGVKVDVDRVGDGLLEGGDGHGTLYNGAEVEDIIALVVGRAGAGVGRKAGGGVGIAEDGGWERVVAAAAEVLATKRHIEPIVSWGGRTINCYIEALADAEED